MWWRACCIFIHFSNKPVGEGLCALPEFVSPTFPLEKFYILCYTYYRKHQFKIILKSEE